MKIYACNLLWALAVGTFTSAAAPLTPQEAYDAAVTQRGISQRMKAPGRSMQLVLTVDDKESSTPALYIFSAPEGAPGFLVAAADDAVTPLVGFSASETFDPNAIPPAMRYWLDCCSEQVAKASSSSAKASAPAKVERAPIAPLVTTLWNQSAPYNNMCPTYNGQNCVTGCVATAMAQVMKYNRWPEIGQGSHTYSYVAQGGKANSLKLDFSTITFDWDNMTDIYDANSSQAENDAVAQLMYACGVATDMKYSTTGSGANSFTAARGMINYFNYDKSLRYLERDWFDADDWNDMVYNELREGRPVIYCGTTMTGVGHAFVCDGYSSNNYFHINWGWGGSCDGYFLLSLLDPGEDQGIGGSSYGYAFNQSIIASIRPNAGSNYRGCMFLNSDLKTTADNYTRTSSTVVGVNGGFYSYALGTVKVYIGLKCENEENTWVIPYNSTGTELQSNYGMSKLSFYASRFPVGEYEVRPVFRTSLTEDWQDFYYDRTSTDNTVHMVVTDTEIIVGDPEPTPFSMEPEFQAILTGFGDDDEMESEFYPEHTYRANFLLRFDNLGDNSWVNDVYCVVFNENGYVAGTDTPKTIDVTGDGVKSRTWTFKLPYLIEQGEYSMALAVGKDGEFDIISDIYTINVAYSPVDGYGKVESVASFGWYVQPPEVTSIDNPAVIDNKYGGFCLRMSCPLGPWSDNTICGAILDSNNKVISHTYTKPVSIAADGTAEVAIYVGSQADWMEARDRGFKAPAKAPSRTIALDSKTTYAFVPWSETHGQMYAEPIYFQLEDMIPTGTMTINADNTSAQGTYFTLAGVPVEKPTSGFYLLREGSKVTKVYVK